MAETIDGLQGGGGQVFFCNSGAESLEGAIKLARRNGGHGKHVVVSALRSFHGRTLATLHATGQTEKHETFQPLPEGFRHVAYNDFDALEGAIDPSCAAVLLEVVQGEGGVNVADGEYLRKVRQLCDERQMLLMFDEVQTGFARTGEWFAWQHHFDSTSDVRPDVVTMAKPSVMEYQSELSGRRKRWPKHSNQETTQQHMAGSLSLPQLPVLCSE